MDWMAGMGQGPWGFDVGDISVPVAICQIPVWFVWLTLPAPPRLEPSASTRDAPPLEARRAIISAIGQDGALAQRHPRRSSEPDMWSCPARDCATNAS